MSNERFGFFIRHCLSVSEALSLNAMPKEKLTPSESQILRELIYPETFGHIQSETALSYGAIRDDLIKLINHGYIEVYDEDSSAPSPFYDSDNIEHFLFKATRSGLKQIQNYGV